METEYIYHNFIHRLQGEVELKKEKLDFEVHGFHQGVKKKS